MKLTFYGAAHEVTGSCFLLEANDIKILVDAGMKQGDDAVDAQDLLFSPKEIDYVLLTHAHIDHSGNLPLLYKHGFRGQIFATEATAELCDIMLRDSAHIQETEAEWKNRKRDRAGDAPVEPLYTMRDAENVLTLFSKITYGKAFSVATGITAEYHDAGHILGSSSITVAIKEKGEERRIVFSGDIGNLDQPLLNDPWQPEVADYIVMEATYGNRLHDEVIDRLPRFAAVIQRTFDRGGNVVIPSFAVGRTQEMLYFIRQIKEQNLVKGHDNFPVYVDSPLAIEATEIFNENTHGFYDEEAMALIKKGINPIGFDNLRKTVTADESKAINFDKTPKIIISASGMCEAGRIRHHLKHNLWRSESTVLFVGYQAAGTLGRKILDGAQKVKLFGEEIAVYADVVSFGGFSAHADRDELLDWLRQLKTPPKRVFVVHGEDGVVDEFADLVTQELGFAATAPYLEETHDLLQDTLQKEGVRQARIAKTRTSRVKTLYTGLQSAEKTLRNLIDRSEGIPNKKMREFTKDLEAIIKKWSS